MFNDDELGNFVNKVGTHSLLDNSRLLLEDLLQTYCIHFCSVIETMWISGVLMTRVATYLDQTCQL